MTWEIAIGIFALVSFVATFVGAAWKISKVLSTSCAFLSFYNTFPPFPVFPTFSPSSKRRPMRKPFGKTSKPSPRKPLPLSSP